MKETPIIPPEVYQSLPPFLKEITDRFKEGRERDMILLSALPVIGHIFRDVEGRYRDSLVHPTLYVLIGAPAASKKSVIKHSRRLGEEIHKHLNAQWRESYAVYKSAQKKWKKEKNIPGNEEKPEPKMPDRKSFYIPGNISAAAIHEHLTEQDGSIIIFETEADTLSESLNQDWGNFSDVLRKGFHHEHISLSRKMDNRFHEISEPKISMVLSGTPGQVTRLLRSAENGLFSRFLHYHFENESEWENPDPSRYIDNPEGFFLEKGKKLEQVYFDWEKFLRFRMKPEQFERLSAVFSEIMEVVPNDHLKGSAFRLGEIAFRIAMILTITRNLEELNLHEELTCADADLETALVIAKVLYAHTEVVYRSLPRAESRNGNGKMEEFYENLPEERNFTRQEGDEIGNNLRISERTVTTYLKKLTVEGRLVLIKHGEYRKSA